MLAEKYFSLIDLFPAFLWMIIFLVYGFMVRNNHQNEPHYRYYMPNLIWKLFFSFLFALVYLYMYEGGDTLAYHDTAVTLNNLFLENPSLYFKQLFADYHNDFHISYFSSKTGYPPGWIFREPEGFFVAKIMSFLSVFTLRSYFAMTFIMAFLTANASWKLYEFVRSFNLNNDRLLAIGVLFLPSVNFWCSGVTKDTVVFIAAIYLVIHAFHIISKSKKATIRNFVFALFYGFLIYHIRSFILIAILIPLAYSWLIALVKGKSGKSSLLPVFRIASLFAGLIIISLTMGSQQSEEEFLQSNAFLQEAAVIQSDFESNEIYGEKRYSLGDISFTPFGLLKAAPLAIIAGIYQPFIWEALSPTLIFNGLESIVFLYFTFLFFSKDLRKKIAYLKEQEILVFCLIFVLLIAFMTGLTSVLFGVLVRLRAPLLPFLFIILTMEWKRSELENNKPRTLNTNF